MSVVYVVFNKDYSEMLLYLMIFLVLGPHLSGKWTLVDPIKYFKTKIRA